LVAGPAVEIKIVGFAIWVGDGKDGKWWELWIFFKVAAAWLQKNGCRFGIRCFT
jgi:hypothetical protein